MGAAATRIVAVAASGGRDSTALLHATAHAARDAGLQVVALHVHHGLNPAADAWQRHVEQQCARWARAGLPVSCLRTRLTGAPARGESVEAWARKGRYQALADMAHQAGASLLLLAHHRRDQAETVLLQALRGGGPAGLSAMPRDTERHGLRWARPWLDQTADAIAAYVARHRLGHIDDDSNLDTRFDRNRLRHGVWPALLAAFPHAEAALAQAARQAQRAAELIDEVARADLVTASIGDELDVPMWSALSAARRFAVLRSWLQPHAANGVRDRLVERLAAELPGARTARWPLAPGRELRLYRGRLRVDSPTPATSAPATSPVRLDQPGSLQLPGWSGRLELVRAEQGGIAIRTLAKAQLRARAPGDDFQFTPRSTARSLKKQYQARGVAEWQRGGPIVALGARPLFVPGLGIDARALARPGEPQLTLHWWPQA